MAKWFEKSDKDKEVAYLLLDKGYYPEACFHAVLAVELRLKGILVQTTGGNNLYTFDKETIGGGSKN
ncbi:HEPN domain-containing protein [Sulfurisphaera ohwakuensis]|uniref:HEPN domain-containing protein n=1 Tax=Sulfurisphaera ohwakuensis TaxID=69656 RepID=A0A7J9RTG8_SULOH|nr:HEPN domain-containing protein [Sulfurisphaera ohwakuensis]MBB5254075.1 HEPN domain-containing protein [Sulfurisphaera ohwakuensis]